MPLRSGTFVEVLSILIILLFKKEKNEIKLHVQERNYTYNIKTLY